MDMDKWFSSDWRKTLLIVSAAFFLIMGGVNKIKENRFIGKSPDFQPTIYVSGEGRVQAVPDVAKITFGNTVTKPTAAEAQTQNTNTMNAFIAAVKKVGIEEKDIQTANFNVYPEYDYTNGKQITRGFTVTQNVEVTVRDTNKTQDLIQLAGTNNLNQVGGLNFTVDKPENYIDQARKQAMTQARANAESIARNAGFRLGRLTNYSESTNPGGYPTPMYADKAMGMGGGGVPAPTINPGTNEIYVQVSLNYEIQQ
jgi:uncharacterized protein YggE